MLYTPGIGPCRLEEKEGGVPAPWYPWHGATAPPGARYSLTVNGLDGVDFGLHLLLHFLHLLDEEADAGQVLHAPRHAGRCLACAMYCVMLEKLEYNQ